MSIRKIEKKDYSKKYLELLNQLKPIKKYDEDSFNSIFDDIDTNPRHSIFVIEDNNIIVGTVTV